MLYSRGLPGSADELIRHLANTPRLQDAVSSVLLSVNDGLCKCYVFFVVDSLTEITLIVFWLQTGQLNEYTERKEMSSSVICMALGRVPSGEQRSRFLAVGLADNTIRIISLQPQVY